MKYLLDVNALVALGISHHQFHLRMESWFLTLGSDLNHEFATCSITELGFVRIASLVPEYGFTIDQAKHTLLQLKTSKNYNFTFIADGNEISNLPKWVKLAKHTTDGHLSELARSNGAVLATLDEHIPGSFLIPTVE